MAVALAGLAALVLAGQAPATFPGADGLVVFSSARDGDVELWAQDVDGSNVRKLLARPGTVEAGASFSPSGTRLVFHSGPPNESDFDLYLLGADGTGLTPLLTGATNDVNAQFCDDGTIVFQRIVSMTDSDLYAIQADGSGLRRLTGDPAFDFRPACSPDGQTVAFASTRGGTSAVYEMPLPPAARRPAGPSLTLLVSPAADPDYSPDGKTLAYVGPDPVDGNTEVFTLDLATRQRTQVSVTPAPLANRVPRFFPSGAGIYWTELTPAAARAAALPGPAARLAAAPKVASTNPALPPIEGSSAAVQPTAACEEPDGGPAIVRGTHGGDVIDVAVSGKTGALRVRQHGEPVCELDELQVLLILLFGDDRVRVETPAGALFGPFTITIDGGPGDDVLGEGSQTNVLGEGSQTMGRAALDALGAAGRGSSLRLLGGPGHDLLLGAGGKDLLVGGAGADTMRGGRGNDTFRAKDGERDVVRGGPGLDAGRFDRTDSVSGVERRR